MEIVKININDLKPYEKNAKLHPREQIEQIKKSIEQFGMNDPIGVWGDENVIVEGHGRLEALKELGFSEVECIRLDHLTDEERKAYTLAHNKLTMNSDFDLDILQEELDNLDTIDMGEFGFDIGVFDSDEYGTEFELPEGDKTSLTTISFSFSQEQADYVNEILKKMKGTPEFKDFCYDENNNSNGNALFLIIKQWEEQKK